MHDPSFMALALIVSEKMTLTQKSLHRRRQCRRRKSNTYVSLLLRRRDNKISQTSQGSIQIDKSYKQQIKQNG